MDYVLHICDKFVLDNLYRRSLPCDSFLAPYADHLVGDTVTCVHGTFLPRDNIYRQYISLSLITWIFGFVIYMLTASLSYWLVFDKRTKNHPRYLRNQIWLEIGLTMAALPGMALLTAFWFVSEVRGHSLLYDDVNDYGVWYLILQIPLFVMFSDCLIYFIHRGLHHRLVYKHLHKPHHKWIMPTPFASHAFHPVDGYLQSLPYHIFPFVFPLHKLAYLALFGFINIWTVLIHDGEVLANNAVVNGAACHTVHHLYYRYNYGQFTTLWDRIGGSYRKADPEIFDPALKMDHVTWRKQLGEVDEIIKREEDQDSRTYAQATDNFVEPKSN